MDDFQRVLKGSEVLDIPSILPLVPVRDIVVFPYSILPLLVGRKRSLKAIKQARMQDNLILVCSQKNPEAEQIKANDVHRVGTVCRILQILEFPNGHSKVVVEGIIRARVKRFLSNRHFFQTEIDIFEELHDLSEQAEDSIRQLYFLFQEYLSFAPDLPEEMLEHLHQQGDPYRMIDFVALNIQAETELKQLILQQNDVEKRLEMLLELLKDAIGLHRVRQEIDQRVQENLMKNQRNYYLQEKLKVINKELEEEEEVSPENAKLAKDIEAAGMPAHARENALEELGKLKKIPPFSPEYTVIRNYLDWMLQTPWSKRTRDTLDIREAQNILDEDHYGLERPKERIVEHLAVLRRVKKMKGPILCLVGPPGVGKTSLGRSVARALGRKFVRISLGGVRDEAEIRGHRRTYIGSLPGKIIQSMKKAGVCNPVFLLDEVDKMTQDFRGDPTAALLEVLDPEQNKTFNDHYLDVDYDLSQVFFITTANVRHDIPSPLQDRMEIIELPGYLEHEKVQIAQRHLIPKQRREHGLSEAQFSLDDQTLLKIIREYTREAGVRNLEREIARLCRKTVRYLSEHSRGRKLPIRKNGLAFYLGKPPFLNRNMSQKKEVGVAVGLAWTPYGGDLLKIEVSLLPGKTNLLLTGKLGQVMKESAQTALSYIRSMAKKLDIAQEVFEKNEIHIHIPEGAVPKEGPSAGVSLTSAMISAFTGKALRNDIAMTGEITLRGKVLAVGGLNEKIMAAQRNDIREVIVPAENHKEVDDLPQELREGIIIHEVSDYPQVLKLVMGKG